MPTTKTLWNDNRQGVRLPEDSTSPEKQEVSIYPDGERIILEPVQVEEWPEEFWQAFGDMPEDFERPAQISPCRHQMGASLCRGPEE